MPPETSLWFSTIVVISSQMMSNLCQLKKWQKQQNKFCGIVWGVLIEHFVKCLAYFGGEFI